tara:strand:+ start:567 stop:797 length:231 start_codon:yes stop_codon:yes gene_type:complete
MKNFFHKNYSLYDFKFLFEIKIKEHITKIEKTNISNLKLRIDSENNPKAMIQGIKDKRFTNKYLWNEGSIVEQIIF